MLPYANTDDEHHANANSVGHAEPDTIALDVSNKNPIVESVADSEPHPEPVGLADAVR